MWRYKLNVYLGGGEDLAFGFFLVSYTTFTKTKIKNWDKFISETIKALMQFACWCVAWILLKIDILTVPLDNQMQSFYV